MLLQNASTRPPISDDAFRHAATASVVAILDRAIRLGVDGHGPRRDRLLGDARRGAADPRGWLDESSGRDAGGEDRDCARSGAPRRDRRSSTIGGSSDWRWATYGRDCDDAELDELDVDDDADDCRHGSADALTGHAVTSSGRMISSSPNTVATGASMRPQADHPRRHSRRAAKGRALPFAQRFVRRGEYLSRRARGRSGESGRAHLPAAVDHRSVHRGAGRRRASRTRSAAASDRRIRTRSTTPASSASDARAPNCTAAHSARRTWRPRGFAKRCSGTRKPRAMRPAGNDEAILRWNTCVRMLDRHERAPGHSEYEPALGD